MTPDTSLGLTVDRRPFRALPGFSDLFADYCEHFERVAPYYAADFRAPVTTQVDRVLSVERDRELLAEVLTDQNSRWGLDEATRHHIELLSSPRTTAVVTGQQVGLFGGPLYTLYKTATAIRLAAEWSSEEHPMVPVFWLEGEDHDLDEIRAAHLLGRDGTFAVEYDPDAPPAGANFGPVGRIELGASIEDAIARVDDELPPTDFHDEVIQALRDTYRPGVTFRDAFARLLRRLFPSAGLVFLSPDDRRLKEAAVPLFLREVDDSAAVARRVGEVSDRLQDDYHAQVRVAPTNLFFIDEQGRSAIDARPEGDGFVIRNHGSVLSADALKDLIREDPCRISPNVVLRPILQDHLLPTVAYVAGPSEIAYFAQFKPVYEWAGLPMPVIYPRASLTFVEARIEKILSRYDLELSDVATDIERLFKHVVLDEMEYDVQDLFERATRHIDAAVEEIREAVVGTDQTLEKALEATRTSMLNEWGKLQGRTLKAEKRFHDEDRDRLERLQDNLFPNGKLQERGLSIIPFLNKYGFGLVNELMTGLSTDTREHQIVVVES